MTRITDKKGKKAQSIALLLFIVILFIAIMLISEFNNIKQTEYIKNQNTENVLNSEWNYIESVINMNYNLAKLQSDEIKDNIISDIRKEYYGQNTELASDLKNIPASDKLINILGTNIKDVYLNNIINDANDPFITSKDMVISDLSLDCASDKRARTFDEEVTMHFNKYLAKSALSAIVKQDDRPVFWSFKNVKSPCCKWYNDVEYMQDMSMDSLKELFMKYETINTLDTIEFISTTYIFDREDILGNPVVTYQGKLNPTSTQIFINSGFNVVDIINADNNLSLAIADYEQQVSAIEYDYNKSIGYRYTIILIECLAFIIVLIAMPKMQHKILDA